MELESYSRLTCNKLCASSNHVSTVKWSTSLTIDEFRWQQDQLLWRKFLSLEFEAKFQTEVALFLELLEFPYNTVSHRSQEALKPISWICSAISTELRFVTGRHRTRAYTAVAQRHTVKTMTHAISQEWMDLSASNLVVLVIITMGWKTRQKQHRKK